MRSMTAAIAFSLLASVAIGGLSGTYTIKPGGGGDFLSLFAAGEALVDSGVSGNCIFEIYGDTLDGWFGAWGVTGSDSWTTTFRPGPGANPVILGSQFYGEGYHNVKIERLRFLGTWITVSGCSGWRISGCRFSTHDWGVKLEHPANHDTVDGNVFDVWGVGMGHYPPLMVEGGSDHVIFNNMFGDDSCGIAPLVDFDDARNTLFVFNTLWLSPVAVAYGNCLWVDGAAPCEVRNNVFVLSRLADTIHACVSIYPTSDSVLLDNNCYFVESLGCIGARPFYPDLYDWDEWRGFGFETNGIYADPMFVSSTNLHLRQGSPCNTRATPIAGINFDMDGDPRDPTHPDIGADEITGGAVEEAPSAEAGMTVAATVVRGVLFLSRSLDPSIPRSLLDVSGRKVLDLKPGANDVRALAPGVYFVREAQAQAQAQVVRKIVVTR